MRIVFIGAGGIGGYFGARLIAAGENVGFVARGAHAQAMRDHGLRVRSPMGDLQVPAPDVHEDPAALAAVGAPDLVVFAVKLPDAEAAAERLAPLVGPGTVVLPLQNGVEAAELLARHVPERAVALGLAYIPTKIAEPGVIEHGGGFARLRFGALHPSQQGVLEAFLGACGRAGIEAEMPADIRLASWEKFVFLTGLSSLTALTREAAGVVRSHAPTRELLRQVMHEATTLGRAEGVALPKDFAERQLAFADTLLPGMKASMLHDLEAGRRLELPWLAGAVVRRSAARGLATPACSFICAALAPFVDGRPRA
ncbi:MAG: ketopantoate reductase family protein [Rubrivivax sp.]